MRGVPVRRREATRLDSELAKVANTEEMAAP
jgi:hypothetical protein